MAIISILSPALSTWDDAYSPCHIISDQVYCLQRYGHTVSLLVCDDFSGPAPEHLMLLPCLPSSDRDAADISDAVPRALNVCLSGSDIIFSHDWISHPRLRPYCVALRDYARGDNRRWYHWIHSIPVYKYPWWDLRALPEWHSIVYPNRTDAAAVAAQFSVHPSRITVIPHICDLRLNQNVSPIIWNIIDSAPGIMNADIVQIYPAAVDRLRDKGLTHLIHIFAEIKRLGRSIFLLIVDSWSGRLQRENIEYYKKLARDEGIDDTELCFMSDIILGFRSLPRRDLFALMTFSNVFVFPSRGEAFGLCMPEAVLAGAFPVPNGSFSPFREILRGQGYYPLLGSCEASHTPSYSECAHNIVRKAPMEKRTIVREYNMDAVYRRYYAPLIDPDYH